MPGPGFRVPVSGAGGSRKAGNDERVRLTLESQRHPFGVTVWIFCLLAGAVARVTPVARVVALRVPRVPGVPGTLGALGSLGVAGA
jgi:hypothetical protein